MSVESIEQQVYAQLKLVLDPELGINIVDLGLIYGVEVSENQLVTVTMTLTTPGCPLHDSIVGGVRGAVANVPEVKHVDVQVVWEPAWTPERISPEGKKMLGHS